MSLMNKKKVQLLLRQLKLRPKKRLGQNFMIDQNIIDKIISLSDLSKEDLILEIGPGLGALTEKLAEKVKKVYAIEIDSHLFSYLKQRFSKYDNIEIINGDILKIHIPLHNKVVSNIPYTITGPIIEKVFFKKKPPQGIITIEKNIAERIFLTKKYKKFSRITIGFNSFMKPIFKTTISRTCFYPIPKIEISLIKVDPKEKINPFFLDNSSIEYYLKFIAGIMPYKNKNIVNALALSFKTNFNNLLNKNDILRVLQEANYKNIKVFSFKIEEYIEISKIFHDLIQ